MQHLVETLMRQAYLFDDPGTYQAGVEDAIEALRRSGLLAAEEAALVDRTA